MPRSHRFTAGFFVLSIHAVFLYFFSSSNVAQPRGETAITESFVVLLLKPRLTRESETHEIDQIAPLKLSANAIIDLSLPPPETPLPLKLTAGVGTLAAGPGNANLPDSRPFAAQAGLAAGQGATVVLRVEVLDDNELGLVVVEVSGGSPAIDAAAISYAHAMPWIGAVVDGKSVPMQVRYAVHLQA